MTVKGLTRHSRRFGVALAAVGASAGLVAVGGGGHASASVGRASSGSVTAQIGLVAAIPNYFSMYGADELGFATKLGLKIDFVTTQESDCVSALVSGSMLACPASLDTIEDAIHSGANLKVVATDEYPAVNTLVVNPSIKSFADMKGKAIAASSPGQSSIGILALLGQHGVKASDVSLLSIGGSPDRYAALQAGKTDGAILAMPQEAVALKAGFRQLGKPTPANSIGDYLVAKPGLTGDKEQALVRLIAAMDETDKYVSNPRNKARVISLWVKNFGLKRQDALNSYEQNVTQFNTWREGTALDSSQITTVSKLDAKYTALKVVKSAASLEDTAYLKAAEQLEKK